MVQFGERGEVKRKKSGGSEEVWRNPSPRTVSYWYFRSRGKREGGGDWTRMAQGAWRFRVR